MYLGSSIIADGAFAKRDSKLLNPQAVSYTHLDVYKRQIQTTAVFKSEIIFRLLFLKKK